MEISRPAPSISVRLRPRLAGAARAAESAGPRQARPAEAAGGARRSDPAPAARRITELTQVERAELGRLQQADREVRAHEAAHKAAAGPHARGAPGFEYERGPDGRSYAVAGEVQVDTSKIPGDPEATLRKMQQVRAAALAPARPSAQDRQVATEAAVAAQQARVELSAQRAGAGPAAAADTSTGPAGAQRDGTSARATDGSGATRPEPGALLDVVA